MPLSFHVIFFYHAALLFRVPTWGLVFFIYALLCYGLSSPSFIIPVLYHFCPLYPLSFLSLYSFYPLLSMSFSSLFFIIVIFHPPHPLSSTSLIILIFHHPLPSLSFITLKYILILYHPHRLSSSSFIILILFLFLINIHPFLSPPPTPEKSLCIPYKLRLDFILTVNLHVTDDRPRQRLVFFKANACRTKSSDSFCFLR